MSDIKTIVINEGKKGADGAVGPAGPPGSPGANGADGADGAIIAVMDEGSTLTSAATSINFVGAGVTATMPTADEILITIPGGSGANTALSNLDVTTAVSQDLLMATGKTLRLPHQTPLLARNSAGTGTIELLQVYGIGNAVFFGNKAAFSYVALDTGNVSISTNNNSDGDVYLSANTLTLGYAGGVSAPKLQFSDRDENFYVSIKAPETLSAGYTLTLPVDDGTAGQVLSTDGAGLLSWVSGGGGITWSTPVNADIVPDADGTRNLGSGANKFNLIYGHSVDISDPAGYIYLDNGGNEYAQFWTQTTASSVQGNFNVNSVLEFGGPSAIYTYNGSPLDIFTRNDGSGSGDIYLGTGNSAANNSGNVHIKTGTSTGVRGEINLLSTASIKVGTATGVNNVWGADLVGISFNPTAESNALGGIGITIVGNQDDNAGFGIVSQDTTDKSSLQFYFSTGCVDGTVAKQSGSIDLVSGHNTNSGTGNSSGQITIASGNVTNGSSGRVILQTGGASGIRGNIELNGFRVDASGSEGPFRAPNLTSDPGTLLNGDVWYNTTSNQLKARVNGSTVVLA